MFGFESRSSKPAVGDGVVMHRGTISLALRCRRNAAPPVRGSVITDRTGTQRLGLGDIAFFPAGSQAEWHVTRPVRKVAVCKLHAPKLISFGTRALNRVRQWM